MKGNEERKGGRKGRREKGRKRGGSKGRDGKMGRKCRKGKRKILTRKKNGVSSSHKELSSECLYTSPEVPSNTLNPSPESTLSQSIRPRGLAAACLLLQPRMTTAGAGGQSSECEKPLACVSRALNESPASKTIGLSSQGWESLLDLPVQLLAVGSQRPRTAQC